MRMALFFLIAATALSAPAGAWRRVVTTAYCACSVCCGKWADGWTASGSRATEGRTAAANWAPFGTRVYVEGVGWRTVEDRMARRFGERLDIYFESHAAAWRHGIRTNWVWVAK